MSRIVEAHRGPSGRAIEAADVALIERGASYVQPLALGRTAIDAAYPIIRAEIIAEVVEWLMRRADQVGGDYSPRVKDAAAYLLWEFGPDGHS